MSHSPRQQQHDDEDTAFRPRRAHRKSRNGCSRCKQRRVKCDELRPSCSRCARHNIRCHYATGDSGTSLQPEANGGLAMVIRQSMQSCASPSGLTSLGPSLMASLHLSNLSEAAIRSSILRACSPSFSVSPSDRGRWSGLSVAAAPTSHEMDRFEVKLLDHYLTHTCHIISFDEQDHYTLHVGIPELAMRCRPLMSSLLALAAACECCDLIDRLTGKTIEVAHTDRMLQLLTFSERRHGESLRGVQSLISDPDNRAYVLANAAMIAIYGSASHQIRLWLVNAAPRCRSGPLPYVFRPFLVQWITLFRSVHLAYTGLQDPSYGPSTLSPTQPSPTERLPITAQPTTITSHSLFEALATSWDQAFESLAARAEHVLQAGAGSADDEACSQALGVLSSVVAELFSVVHTLPFVSSSRPRAPTVGLEFPPLTQIPRVPTWLHLYLARATCMAPSTPLRRTRTTMAFANRVPADYLTLIEMALNYEGVPETGDSASEGPQPALSYRLALDILAHWLVFVMLLDGLWWVGETGAWELEMVISLVRTKNWGTSEFEAEDWWPEQMLGVRQARQRVYFESKSWDSD